MALFAKEFGKAFIFKKIRPGIRSFFLKAGYDDVPYDLFGYLFYVTLVITYCIYLFFVYPGISAQSPLNVLIITFVSWFGIQIGLLTIIFAYLYFSLTIKIYTRTKMIEEILPDYLQVVSSNLKGGMSFEKSLWSAIKPEFGIVAKEITIVSKKVMTGNDLAEALQEFTEKYDSPILRRSFDLIIGEIETGGKIAATVDKVVESIRHTKVLKEEMAASTLTFIIFIAAVVIVIAPGLFALSYHLLNTMVGFGGALSNVNTSTFPIKLSFDGIDPETFKIFSYGALTLISLFSAMIISIIQKGDIKGGIKLVPMFVISSITFYMFFVWVFGVLFGGMLL